MNETITPEGPIVELTKSNFTLHAHRTFDVPADVAWSVVGDYHADPTWRRGVIAMTLDSHPEVRPGSTTVESLRFGGTTYRNVGEIVAVGPYEIAWRTVEGARAAGRRSVRSLGGRRCEVHLEVTVEPTGRDRLLAPVLRRMLGRTMRRDLERLDGLLAGDREGRILAATRRPAASGV